MNVNSLRVFFTTNEVHTRLVAQSIMQPYGCDFQRTILGGMYMWISYGVILFTESVCADNMVFI